MKRKNVFILGTLLGAAASLLLTPKSGKEMQKELLRKAEEVQGKLKDFEINEAKEIFVNKLDEVKELINNFDWEASKAEIEGKFAEVKGKLNDITTHLDDAKANIKEEAQNLGESLEDDFTLVIDTVKDTVKDTASQAKTTVTDVADVIKEDSKLIVDTAKGTVDQIKTAVTDTIKDPNEETKEVK